MSDRRGFVGVELPRDVVEGLVHAQRDLQAMAQRLGAQIEVVPPPLLHITLDDLGDIPDPALEAVELAIERLLPRNPPFSVRVRGFGAFPDRARPRVVWAAVEDRDRLVELRAELHASLAGYGFAVEPGRYQPHVALARVSPEFGELDEAFGATPFGTVRVRRLAVFRRRPPGRRGPLFQPELTRDLERFPENAGRPKDDAALRREIAARLGERLERRDRTRAPRPDRPRTRKQQQQGEKTR